MAFGGALAPPSLWPPAPGLILVRSPLFPCVHGAGFSPPCAGVRVSCLRLRLPLLRSPLRGRARPREQGHPPQLPRQELLGWTCCPESRRGPQSGRQRRRPLRPPHHLRLPPLPALSCPPLLVPHRALRLLPLHPLLPHVPRRQRKAGPRP